MRRVPAPHHGARDRWLVSYADLVTLLLACFTTTYAATQSAPPAAPAPPAAAVAAPIASPVEAEPTTTAVLDHPPSAETPPGDLGLTLKDLIAPLVDATGGVTLLEDHRGLVISLPESATFPIGSAAISAEARQFLVRLSDTLRTTTVSIRVEGHTDDVPITGGRYPSNWELSTARASAVVMYLIDGGQFAASRLSAAGYGEFHPRASNASPAGRMLNRRVDVVLIEPAAEALTESVTEEAAEDVAEDEAEPITEQVMERQP
jgi:chemotaxis protein MotB